MTTILNIEINEPDEDTINAMIADSDSFYIARTASNGAKSPFESLRGGKKANPNVTLAVMRAEKLAVIQERWPELQIDPRAEAFDRMMAGARRSIRSSV